MRQEVFVNRRIAGRELAQKLRPYQANAVVYALPRGGVEIGLEIARELKTPLDLIIARKIGHPGHSEYAIGAVTETGPPIWNKLEKATVDPVWLKQAETSERQEAQRRRKRYLAGHKSSSATGKTAIIVDDGLATGLTMQAAIQELKKQKPNKIVVAVPVAPPDSVYILLRQIDEVVLLIDPLKFRGSVGAHYRSFPQLKDEDVITILEAIR